MASSTMEARASADLTSVSIDPNDIQQFEQSYESWIQGIVQNIIPSKKPVVLVDITYTQNPDRLQTYSELRSIQHLPGLPEVMDPHFTHPSESPISALVENRKVKIIFESALSAPQEKILSEVLNSKLRINANSGDRVVVSTIEAAPAPRETNRLKDPRIVSAAIFACLALTLLLARRQKQEDVKADLNSEKAAEPQVVATVPAPVAVAVSAPIVAEIAVPTPPPFRFKNQEKVIIDRLAQFNSTLTTKTSSIINPTQIILKSEPKAIVRVIRQESAENIARALQGTSILFQKTVLSICTSRQRNQIREKAKSLTITPEAVLFAQNLIAAKIYREMQTLALRTVETYVKAAETVKTEKATMSRLRQELTQSQQTPAAESSNSERSSEVQL